MGEDQVGRAPIERIAAMERENEMRRERDAEDRAVLKEIYDISKKTELRTANIENALGEGRQQFNENKKRLDEHDVEITDIRHRVVTIETNGRGWRRLLREVWGFIAGAMLALLGGLAAGFHWGR